MKDEWKITPTTKVTFAVPPLETSVLLRMWPLRIRVLKAMQKTYLRKCGVLR
jgi:hypothetical protein